MKNPEAPIKNTLESEANKIADTLSLPDEYIRDWQDKGLEKQAEAYETVKRICHVIQEAGGRALLVGGAVRDLLLHREEDIKDFDLEVYNLELDQLEDLLRPFGKMSAVGKSFAVHKLFLGNGVDIDISLPRRDSKTGNRHGDFTVATDPYMAVSEAARRRDFTINAILADPLTGQILDPFHGVEDLQSKTLRVVDEERFPDDHLRILRAMQFVGRFDLQIDPKSKALMMTMLDDLKHLAPERIGDEWAKLLLKAEQPSLGLQVGMDLGILKTLHPQFVALAETPQDPERHPEGAVWEHTKLVVDKMAEIARREKLSEQEMWPLMLAALCHDLGKAETTTEKDGKIIAHGHELASAALSKTFLDGIRVDKNTEARVLALVSQHMRPMYLHQNILQNNEIKDSVFRRLARDVAPASIQDLAFLSEADKRAVTGADQQEIERVIGILLSRAKDLGVDRQPASELMTGKDFLNMGYAPGPEIGRLIQLSSQLRDVRGFDQDDIRKSLASVNTSVEAMGVLEKLLRQD